MSQRTSFHAHTPLQALLVEQALLLAQQLESTQAPASRRGAFRRDSP
jgi:hypothetical protein